jgi:hypothetical protein
MSRLLLRSEYESKLDLSVRKGHSKTAKCALLVQRMRRFPVNTFRVNSHDLPLLLDGTDACRRAGHCKVTTGGHLTTNGQRALTSAGEIDPGLSRQPFDRFAAWKKTEGCRRRSRIPAGT